MSSLHRGVKELANCQDEFKAAMSTHVNLLSAQVVEIHSLLTKNPSSPAIEATPSPVAAGALSVLTPSATALPLRSFPVSLENAVLSSLTVKCVVNSCNQPFPQSSPKWHL